MSASWKKPFWLIPRWLAPSPSACPTRRKARSRLRRSNCMPGSAAGEGELLEWCRQHLAAYKAPRRIWILEPGGLPQNHNGKACAVLRERFEEIAARAIPKQNRVLTRASASCFSENQPYSCRSICANRRIVGRVSRPARHAGRAPAISPASIAIPIACARSGQRTEAETMLAVCGMAASTRRAIPSERDAEKSPAQAQYGCLKLDEEQVSATASSPGREECRSPRAFEDRHRHGVGNAEDSDEQGKS